MIPEFIASQFKKPSGLLGVLVARLMKKSNEKNYNRLITDLAVKPGDKILEIGYGPGIGIKLIAENCTECFIEGIDFSNLMYKKASQFNKNFIADGNVRLHQGDFIEISLPANNYDKIFCLNVVYFWNELSRPFGKIRSLLKDGGAFHMYMADINFLKETKAPDSVFNKYTIEQVEAALKAAGFENVEHYPKNGHYIKAK